MIVLKIVLEEPPEFL